MAARLPGVPTVLIGFLGPEVPAERWVGLGLQRKRDGRVGEPVGVLGPEVHSEQRTRLGRWHARRVRREGPRVGNGVQEVAGIAHGLALRAALRYLFDSGYRFNFLGFRPLRTTP